MPLFNQEGRLLRQFPTEDGYLMLTIARNIALGNGMSTAQGTIATNGTQPLFNFIEAIGFFLLGGNKEAGVAFALLAQILIGALSAGLLFITARHVLQKRSSGWQVALVASALWYSSSLAIPHTMNCLETGAYVACILLTVHVWHRYETARSPESKFSWQRSLVVGALLGLTAWARIDAVFLIASVTGCHVLLGLLRNRYQLLGRLCESVVMGSLAVLIISPWLLYNKLNFGSFTPISGTAQSHAATFGQNLVEVPSSLFESAAILIPIPHSIEQLLPVLATTSTLVVAYVIALAIATPKMEYAERSLTYVVGALAIFLVMYYGVLFGAAHFVDRYLFPLSPFMAIFTTFVVVTGLEKLAEMTRIRKLLPLSLTAVLIFSLLLNVRLYKLGTEHAHFQVVNWVERNVSEAAWVGAVQTGTLGFFHDRTVNLDGKVNPEALQAKLERKIPHYIVYNEFDAEGNKIDYLADWTGIASWQDLSPLDTHFELVVNDDKKNLAVLQRKI
ncbi:MAG: hypothetical protein VKK04_14860 [Synechococcales bacterium]|nr:hypothetical protein [Synechococcales bacterium]